MVTVAKAKHVTMSTVGVLADVTKEFKARHVKKNVGSGYMVKTAGISVAQTVMLPGDVTGLPEAVTEDVNQDGQGVYVVNNVTPGNMERIVSKTVVIVNKETSVTLSMDSVQEDVLQDTMDHFVLNLVKIISMELTVHKGVIQVVSIMLVIMRLGNVSPKSRHLIYQQFQS